MSNAGCLFLGVAGAIVLLAMAPAAQAPAAVPQPLTACIANGTKVGHTYIDHPDPAKLREAVRIYQTRALNPEYPEGTIVRMIPQEAMVKRSKAAFPNTNGWEYFALAITPQGTTVRARGDDASNRLGSCRSCHAGATQSDSICGAGPGCPPVPLTEEQVAMLQANDPRCAH
jgi:hypothetical protein